ncbi:MAG: polysaccharide deacetylase family protein [Deltaproteobacteria bacterium]|nr:polysaccharide deacetylase family protein [Deltaproteobacteria bacterium]
MRGGLGRRRGDVLRPGRAGCALVALLWLLPPLSGCGRGSSRSDSRSDRGDGAAALVGAGSAGRAEQPGPGVPGAVVAASSGGAIGRDGADARPAASALPASGAAPESAVRKPPPREERTQFVLLSFDTTPSWQGRGKCSGFCQVYEGLNRDRDPDRPPNSFTLFMSTGGMQFAPERRDLTEEEQRYLGVEPRLAPVYKYAERLEQVLAKAQRIRELDELGVELASHTVRHRHGADWSEDEWRSEIADHQRILDLVGLPHPAGFRAPFLEWSPGLYPALEDSGAVYDSSQVGGRDWPRRHPGTRIWVFGLPSVSVPGRGGVLFFDDNVRSVLRQAAIDAGVTGEERITAWVDDAYGEAALREFQAHYSGNRAPFLISSHGVILEPILRVMRRICPLPDVRCATFREAAAYLDEHPELEGVGDE